MSELKNKTLKELKDLARQYKIKNFSTKKKAELIELIESFLKKEEKDRITEKTKKIKETQPEIIPLTFARNRIRDAIKLTEKRLKDIDPSKLETYEKALNDTSLSELISFQNVQSKAFASQKINFDEAQLLFNLIGGDMPTINKFKKRSLAEKIVVTQTMGELISRR